MLLNPGSAMDRRREPTCTIAILTITDGAPAAEIIPVSLESLGDERGIIRR